MIPVLVFSSLSDLPTNSHTGKIIVCDLLLLMQVSSWRHSGRIWLIRRECCYNALCGGLALQYPVSDQNSDSLAHVLELLSPH